MVTNRTLGTIAAGVGGVALGSIVGVLAAKGLSKKRRAKRGKNRKKRSYSKKNTRRSRRTPRTAGKRRDTSHKRIRYTKNGQPYIILRSGKARFIKKSSSKRSHKKRGGRY